jgi:hypothetical protein
MLSINLSTHTNDTITTHKASLYDSLNLVSLGLSKDAFDLALTGYNSLLGKLQNENIITIIDFSMPSSKKRLFIIDIVNGNLLFNTFVSHGKNSGTSFATKFSNKFNSLESSVGFYITGSTYTGKHGYSLRLNGKEKGINDNAFDRGIVVHSAPYVSEKTIQQMGYLGRSQGCAVIPEYLKLPIINTIKDGTCLFIYTNKYSSTLS